MNLHEEKVIKILLALDLASQNIAARELALSLAGRLQSELVGLIIEDEELLASAQYPFSSEINTSSALERKLSYADMERSLRAWSTQIQQQLLKQAQQANVKCSFRTFRGRKTEILLEQTETTSLLVFSGLRTSYTPRQHRANTVYILVDDSSDLEHSLTIAKQLIAEGIDNVALIGSGDSQSEDTIAGAINTISGTGAQVLQINFQTDLSRQLATMNRNHPAAVVLVPATHQICRQNQKFKELQRYLSCPVVVVN